MSHFSSVVAIIVNIFESNAFLWSIEFGSIITSALVDIYSLKRGDWLICSIESTNHKNHGNCEYSSRDFQKFNGKPPMINKIANNGELLLQVTLHLPSQLNDYRANSPQVGPVYMGNILPREQLNRTALCWVHKITPANGCHWKLMNIISIVDDECRKCLNHTGVITCVNKNSLFVWSIQFGNCFVSIDDINRKVKSWPMSTWVRFNIESFNKFAPMKYKITIFEVIEDEMPTKTENGNLLLKTVVKWDASNEEFKSPDLGVISNDRHLLNDFILYPHAIWVIKVRPRNSICWAVHRLIGPCEKIRLNSTSTTNDDASAYLNRNKVVETPKKTSNRCLSYNLLVRLFDNAQFRILLNENDRNLFVAICEFILTINPC